MTPATLLKVKDWISTIHEYNGTETTHKVNDTLCNAKNIYFLGFGHHKENMKLLNISRANHIGVMGTAFRLYQREIDDIQSKNVFLEVFTILKIWTSLEIM